MTPKLVLHSSQYLQYYPYALLILRFCYPSLVWPHVIFLIPFHSSASFTGRVRSSFISTGDDSNSQPLSLNVLPATTKMDKEDLRYALSRSGR